MKNKLTDLFELIEIIQQFGSAKQKEYISLEKSTGRLSARDILSEFDFPDTNRSRMDGYAVSSSNDLKTGLSPIQHLSANEIFDGKLKTNECVRCSTGSKLADFLNIVIPVEYTKEENGKIYVSEEFSPGNDFIEQAGNIIKKGDTIISEGDIIDHRNIEKLALCRVNTVEVYKKPTIAIISTGSELTELYIQQTSVMNSNFYMISSFLENKKIPYNYLGIVQDKTEDIAKKLNDSTENYDLVVSFGGTALGKYDLITDAVSIARGELIVDGVNCSPGKTFKLARINNKPVFICPGNPASAAVCIELFLNIFINSNFYFKSPDFIKIESAFSLNKKAGFYKLIPSNIVFENNNFKIVDNLTRKVKNPISRALSIIPKDSSAIKKGDVVDACII